jgi:hypothetical protein
VVVIIAITVTGVGAKTCAAVGATAIVGGLFYAGAKSFAESAGKETGRALVEEVVRPAIRAVVGAVKRAAKAVGSFFKRLWNWLAGSEPSAVTEPLPVAA